jgi:hypothetical protein
VKELLEFLARSLVDNRRCESKDRTDDLVVLRLRC